MNYEFKPLPVGRLVYTDRALFEEAVRIAKAEPMLAHGIEIVYAPRQPDEPAVLA